MHRLERRKIILEGKRHVTFDPSQYWFDGASRTRLERKVRVHLRAGSPVVLITPRWSGAASFLDDLAIDLSMGDPCVRARPLSLEPLKGLSTHQAWAWIAGAVAEFCQLTMAEGPAWQAVSRRGFRTVLADLFARAEGGRARCLMLHGLQHVNVEALHDLFEVFGEHVAKYRDERSFNLLFSGSIDAAHVDLEAAVRLQLDDFDEAEAIERLVEHMGPIERHRLLSVVAMVGGVPDILDAIGAGEPSLLTKVLTDRDAMWKALGSVAEEVRSAIDIVSADNALADRLEKLARNGAQSTDTQTDDALLRAGLVLRSSNQTQLRTPWFADLVLAG